MSRTPILMLFSLACALWACNEGSQPRKCEPVTNSGCLSGETCGIDATGAPLCVVSGLGGEGASCEVADDCSTGLGCVRMFGLARCLRFCDPVAALSSPVCAASARASFDRGHPASSMARCLAALPDRPDIGICVLPCHPAEVGRDCPEAATCEVPRTLDMAVCAPAGAALADGEACGPARRCAAGSICALRGVERVCRPSADELGGCPGDTRLESQPGAYDPINARAYAACSPCTVVGQFDGRWYSVCHRLVRLDPSGALEVPACTAEGGALAMLEGKAPETLASTLWDAASLQAVSAGFGGAIWLGARRVNGGWRWESGVEVPATLVAAGEGDCLALADDSGTLTPVACDRPQRALCVLE